MISGPFSSPYFPSMFSKTHVWAVSFKMQPYKQANADTTRKS
jgi:hypothetical protein